MCSKAAGQMCRDNFAQMFIDLCMAGMPIGHARAFGILCQVSLLELERSLPAFGSNSFDLSALLRTCHIQVTGA